MYVYVLIVRRIISVIVRTRELGYLHVRVVPIHLVLSLESVISVVRSILTFRLRILIL